MQEVNQVAKYVDQIPGDIDEFTSYFEKAILERKLFSTVKHQFRTKVNDVCCSVQVFEGYTFLGGNWLTMNVTAIEYGGQLKVAVMTSGGSNALFFKNSSLGVDAEIKMLKEAKEIISDWPISG